MPEVPFEKHMTQLFEALNNMKPYRWDITDIIKRNEYVTRVWNLSKDLDRIRDLWIRSTKGTEAATGMAGESQG